MVILARPDSYLGSKVREAPLVQGCHSGHGALLPFNGLRHRFPLVVNDIAYFDLLRPSSASHTSESGAVRTMHIPHVIV